MNIFRKMLVLLGIRHTRVNAAKTYRENPNKNNFLGLCEMFLSYNIQTISLKFKEIKVSEIPMPFIGFYSGDFCIVENFTKDNRLKVFCRDTKKIITQETFYEGWNGYAMCITDISSAVEKNYTRNFKEQLLKDLLFVISILLLSINIIVIFLESLHLTSIILLLLNSCGLYFSYLSIRINSKAKKNICKMFGENDCNTILTSNASKLFGVFSLGEIGISYFLSNTIILLFFKELVPVLIYINTVVLLGPIGSVYYQKFIAESWCTICLLVQLVLVTVFLTLAISGMLEFKYVTNWELFKTVSVFIVLFFIIHKLIYFTYIANEYDKTYSELISIKSNHNFFDSLLKNQHCYDTESSSNIIFHKKDSDRELTIILNPYCAPCKILHKKIHTLEKEGELNTYRLKLLFTAFTTEKEKIAIAIIGHYYNHTPEETLELINSWYQDNNIELLMNYYNRYSDDLKVQNEFDNQTKWLFNNKITGTPTVLYNGYIFPEEYDVDQIKYLK